MEMGKTKSNTALNNLIQELNTLDAGDDAFAAGIRGRVVN